MDPDKTIISVQEDESGDFFTRIDLNLLENSHEVGIILAGITRTIASAIRDHCSQGEFYEEQFQAAVAEAFNQELQFGPPPEDLGPASSPGELSWQ